MQSRLEIPKDSEGNLRDLSDFGDNDVVSEAESVPIPTH